MNITESCNYSTGRLLRYLDHANRLSETSTTLYKTLAPNLPLHINPWGRNRSWSKLKTQLSDLNAQSIQMFIIKIILEIPMEMSNGVRVLLQSTFELHWALRWKTDNHQFYILPEDSCGQSSEHSPATSHISL